MTTLLVKNIHTLATFDAEQREIRRGALFVRDHVIEQVGTTDALPDTADEVLDLIRAQGLSVTQRSRGATLGSGAQVYLADTMGETDLWYALSPIVFLGGAFTDVGGHTPFEPAAAHTAIIHGPLYANFSEVYAAFQMKDASVQVADGTALADEVATLLTHPSRAAQLAANAKPLAQSNDAALEELATRLFSMAQTHAMGPHD